MIITEVTSNLQPTILNKVTEMNKTLQNPDDGLPAVSLSVVGAFSTQGFTDSLYTEADSALYIVKEHGRCGCHFYDEKEAAES